MGTEYADLQHTINRFKERFKKKISPREYAEMCKIAGKSEPIKKVMWGRSERIIDYKGDICKIIWSEKRKRIITVYK